MNQTITKKPKIKKPKPVNVNVIERIIPEPPVPVMRERVKTIPKEQHLINLSGYIETVTTIPSTTPKSFYESIKIYMDSLSSPTTKRLYIYSFEAKIWNYVTLS